MKRLQFNDYSTLTFDCYGTIIDWESGIAHALAEILSRHDISLDRERILALHARFEPEIQAEEYLSYRETLKRVVDRFGVELNFLPTESDRSALPQSIENWAPFPDSRPALQRLQKRYKLVVISNIDDDLFAHSQSNVAIQFDNLITAQQVGAYKPSLKMFDAAFEKLDEPKERILHVAQSLFHDIAPANKLGLDSVWVDRRRGLIGSGATPVANALPDLQVASLQELADLIDQSFDSRNSR